MKNTRLENVIKQVKNARTGTYKSWIFNDDGTIKDNVITGEVLYLLEEMKEYEISVSDEYIADFLKIDWHKRRNGNTYNIGTNISNDIDYKALEIDDGCIFLIQIHLDGDIRCGYSDYFVLKMEDFESFFELENWIQSKMLNDRYCADINLLSETYSVYDYEKQENVGDFYEREVEDLLNQINEDN